MQAANCVYETQTKSSTLSVVESLKNSCEDFEFYPTTDEIIQIIKSDQESLFGDSPSVLDIGCGDGRVLDQLTTGKKYGIEKSSILRSSLSKDIFVVGCDFHEQSLLDKKTDILFCNPPYGEYDEWFLRIAKECHAKVAYLVVPKRWSDNPLILSALKERNADATIIASTDFLSADRAARAKVDVLRVMFGSAVNRGYRSASVSSVNTDPFKLWFSEHFPQAETKSCSSLRSQTSLRLAMNDMLSSGDLVTSLVTLYERDLNNMLETYRHLSKLDPALLKELGCETDALTEGLKLKIKGLKDLYWNELFSNLDTVRSRLTSKSRDTLFGTLTEHSHVDFNKSNIHAIVEWVCKNANDYIDVQLIDMFHALVSQANVINYKSNEKVFKFQDWRYNKSCHGESLPKLKLDYRIIKESWRVFDHYRSTRLTESAENLINDLVVIAKNLGFNTTNTQQANSFMWDSRVKNHFTFNEVGSEKEQVLFAVTGFKNGNLHIFLNQKFACKLNVEFGRLMGWLRTKEEAATELDISVENVAQAFNSNFKIAASNVLSLGYNQTHWFSTR